MMNKAEEVKLLRAIYKDTPNAEIATLLGMSIGMVVYRACCLGLKKDPKYLSDVNRRCGMKSSVARTWKCFQGE